jgi:hypothetical protein
MLRTRFFSYLRVLSIALAATILTIPATVDAAAKITIVNNDGPGEGFNDPTQLRQLAAIPAPRSGSSG